MDLKICRICCENSDGVSIFNTDCDGILFSTKVMYCCSKIEINDYDGLPSHICSFCEKDLAIAYRLVLKCEATDKTLRTQSRYINSSKRNDLTLKIEIKAETTDTECNVVENEIMDYSPDELEVPLEDICRKLKLQSNYSDKGSTKYIDTTKNRNKSRKKTFRFKGSQKCPECGRECANPSTLAIHKRSHTNDKPFQCEFCNKKYKDPSSLKRHMERNHTSVRERRFICESCGKGFYSRTDIIIHLRTHTGETPYACTECPSSFTQLSSLIRHRKKHLGNKTETCNVCCKKFCTRDQLQRHYQVHKSSKEFACNICHNVFKYKHNLTKHYKLHSDPNSYVCNHCGRTFNSKGNLKIHINRVHSEKSGYCNTCCKIVSNIEVHMLKHTGERPLKCELCTKTFFELKSLNQHMNFSHNHTDKYKCTVDGCPRSFPSKPMLDYHVAKLHENRFTFPCDKCSRGFYRKNDLARHKIGTHKEKLL